MVGDLDIGDIWEGATFDSFRCVLHPFPFVLLEKVSPLGRSLEPHLCSLFGDFRRGPIAGLSVTCCPLLLIKLPLTALSPYLLVTSDELYGRGLLKMANGASLASLHLQVENIHVTTTAEK